MRLFRKISKLSHAFIALLHCGNFPIPDRNNWLLMTSKAAHSSSQRSFIGLATLLLPVVSQDQEPGAPPPAPGFFHSPLNARLPMRPTPVSPLSRHISPCTRSEISCRADRRQPVLRHAVAMGTAQTVDSAASIAVSRPIAIFDPRPAELRRTVDASRPVGRKQRGLGLRLCRGRGCPPGKISVGNSRQSDISEFEAVDWRNRDGL